MDLEDMKGAIILLALISLIGAASAIALDDFRSDIKEDMDSTAVTNETETTLTNSSTVDCTFVVEGTAFGWANNSGTTYSYLDSTNLTISEAGGVILNANYANNYSLLNYNCYAPNYQYNITSSGLKGVDNTTSYLDTIGTIIGVAVLIGIVVLAFTFARR